MKDTDGRIYSNKFIERLNTISFWELLTETSKIQIPIIQRDYAQGRNDDQTKKIRNKLLDDIISVLSGNQSLELDFVYGNVENKVFQPLDGQQRLTTLFLLHWYIAVKTGELSNSKNHFLKFTYETRISSREFCNELVEKGELLGEGKTISEKITDSAWFYLSWKKDPTIKAMLTMLDSIEEKLKEKEPEELKAFWQKLTSENPPITFHFKELNDIGLTDDLYIKMNARGKMLTAFENFKARFEKHIKEKEFEKELELNEDNKEWWKDLTEKTFAHRIDTTWTDLFWKHRGDDNLIDNELIKFVAGIAINSYAQSMVIYENSDEELNVLKYLEDKKGKSITDNAVKRERIERRIRTLYDNPSDVSPTDFPTKDAFEYLKKCFDIYSNKEKRYDELLPDNLPLWDFIKKEKVKISSETELDNNFFIDFIFIKPTKTEYKQRVLFYAQTQYLLNVETFNAESFSEWMRVVRNIVQNSTVDSAAAFIGAIGFFDEISKGCQSIYQYLAQNNIQSGFAAKQVEEEKLKANLIQNEILWKVQIFKVEDDKFLKGEIRFLLGFAKEESEHNYHSFNQLSDAFLLLFEHKNDLLRFALLTQEDYKILEGRTSSLGWIFRYSLLNTEGEWKHAINKNEKFQGTVLKLLQSTLIIEGNRLEKLRATIKNYTPQNDYRDFIIKDESLLRTSQHKRICISGTKLYILNKTRVKGGNYTTVAT